MEKKRSGEGQFPACGQRKRQKRLVPLLHSCGDGSVIEKGREGIRGREDKKNNGEIMRFRRGLRESSKGRESPVRAHTRVCVCVSIQKVGGRAFVGIRIDAALIRQVYTPRERVC